MGARDYSVTAGDNLLVGGISIAEGWAPDQVNNAQRAVLADTANLLLDLGGAAATTGTSPAYLLNLPTAPAAYADNFSFVCKLHASVTGAATINVNGLGVKSFKKLVNGTARDLDARDGPIGHRASCIYSSADNAVLLLNPASSLGLPYIDEIGPPVGGDWTTVFQAAATAGGVFQLRPNTTYTVTSRIECTTDGFGLIGPRSARIYLPAANWTNANILDFIGAQACVFYAHGVVNDASQPLQDFTLRGFTIEAEVVQSRVISVITGIGIANVDICDLEIFGLSTGAAIRLSTVSGIVADNYIRDCLQTSDTGFTGGSPQTTGISIDDIRYDDPGPPFESNVNSHDLVIARNRIHNLLFRGAALVTFGAQTDGINLGGASTTQKVSRILVANNQIDRVGEGIDTFSSGGVYVGNLLTRCDIHGFKLAHGASYNVFSGNNVYDCGLSGMVISGTNSGNCIGNLVTGGIIRNLNPEGLYTGADTTCIWFGVNDLGHTYDNMIRGMTLDPGTAGKWTIRKEAAVGDHNYLVDCVIKTGTSGYLTSNGRDVTSILPTNKTDIYAYVGANQTFLEDVGLVINYTTVVRDALSEWVLAPVVSFIPKFPGIYDVVAQIRVNSLTTEYTFACRVNGAAHTTVNDVHVGSPANIILTTSLILDAADEVTFSFVHSQNPSAFVTGQQQYSFITIKARG